MKIQGCVALVTGANRGLGKAIVEALVNAGAAKVYAASRRGGQAASERVVPLELDTTRPEQVAAAARAASGGASAARRSTGRSSRAKKSSAGCSSFGRRACTTPYAGPARRRS